MGQQAAPQQALENALRSIAGSPTVVLITGHPDPDALGSAIAHQRICAELGVPCTIAHVLPVSHRQNRAMVKLLNIDMLQVSNTEDLANFKYLSLVDTSTPEPSIALPADLKLLSVVDHHKMAEVDAPFADIRPQMGASSSIYAEYMLNGLAPLVDGREATRVATALLFGMQTDTNDFTLATGADFAAAAYVRPFCDSDVLKRMGRSDLTMHGFRSTFRDWCSERTNYPRELAEQALAHALENKVEAAYRRGDALEKRMAMMQAWADFCVPPSSNFEVGQLVPPEFQPASPAPDYAGQQGGEPGD